MALSDTFELVGRTVARETLGAVVRAKAKRANHATYVAYLLGSGQARNTRTLEREDFLDAAQQWVTGQEAVNAMAATLHAIADVESGNMRGFDERGRLTILVEPHIFSRETKHAFDRSHPWLSYPTWIRHVKDAAPPAQFPAHPYTYSMDDRWGLFAMMAELDPQAALCALSAGRFQQLIAGWRALRMASAEALFHKLAGGEREHLDVLAIYLVAHGLTKATIARDWRAIARGYNGPGQVDLYASRMAEAFKRRIRIYS